jgi:hypothetical protein
MFRAAAVLVVLLSLTATAFAQDPPERVPLVPTAPAAGATDAAAPEGDLHWYGWQNLGVDLAATAILAGGVASENKGLLVAGAGVYAFGSPLVHFSRGHVGRGVGSLALRVGAPLLTGLLTEASIDCDNNNCDGAEYLMPFVTGGMVAIGAALLDDVAFTFEREPARTWTPVVTPVAHGGMTLGLAGTF